MTSRLAAEHARATQRPHALSKKAEASSRKTFHDDLAQLLAFCSFLTMSCNQDQSRYCIFFIPHHGDQGFFRTMMSTRFRGALHWVWCDLAPLRVRPRVTNACGALQMNSHHQTACTYCAESLRCPEFEIHPIHCR